MSLTYHLLQTMSQAVCCCDEHGVVQASSPAARTLLQHTSETLHNKSLLELIHADDIDRLEIDRLEDALVSLTRQTAVSPCTLRLLNGDACAHAYQTVRVRFTGHEEGSGLLEHILLWLEPAPVQAPSQVHDKVIAEVGQTRTAIAPTEPYTINRNTPVAVCNNDFASTSSGFYVDERPAALCVFDRQWRFVHLNDTAAQLADKILNDLPLDDLPLDDLPLDDLRGQSLWQVFPNIQHNHIGQTLQHAVEAREPVYFETLNDDDNPRLNFAWFGVHVLPVGEQIVLKIEDITERKYQQQQLEAAQDRSEELFEQRNTVLDAISDCVFMVDASYRFTYVNQAGLELFDVTLEDVLGKPMWDVLHLPEGSPFRQIYLDTMTTGNPQRVRALSRHPKLQGHTLDVKTTPFRGGFIAYSRDVTELEALHAELTQTLADKEAILDSITDGVTVLDRQGVYLYANERVRRRNPDIIGKAYAELFPEHQVSIFETYYQRAFDSQEVVCFEAQTHRGSWMDVRVYPAGDRITVYATDFSESKRLEQALRDSEAKFRTFFESVHPECTPVLGLQPLLLTFRFLRVTCLQWQVAPCCAVTHPAEHKSICSGWLHRYLKRDGSVIWASLEWRFCVMMQVILPFLLRPFMTLLSANTPSKPCAQ